MEYENLFKEKSIKGIKFKNRIIYPAISTKMVDKEGYPKDNLLAYYLERARDGAGLIIIEPAFINNNPGLRSGLSIAHDKYLSDLKKLVKGIKEEDTLVGIQLKYVNENYSVCKNDFKVDEKVNKIIKDFIQAGERLDEIGVDLLEIRISKNDFLEDLFNRIKKDTNFLDLRIDIIREIIKKLEINLSRKLLFCLKINIESSNNHKAFTEKEIVYLLNKLDKYIDGVTLVGNITTSSLKSIKNIRKKVSIPIALNTGLDNPENINFLLDEYCDFVAIGRGILADPKFVKKVYNGENPIKCFYCNEGCYNSLDNPIYPNITCIRNPFIGFEGKDYIPENKGKKIAIIGGGIAGIKTAIYLNERGHTPTIYEASESLGGQLLIRSRYLGNEKVTSLLKYLNKEVKSLNIDVKLSKKFSEQDITIDRYDSVVIATGASHKVRNKYKGEVISILELLNKAEHKGRKIIIIGDKFLALELSSYLVQKSNEIFLLSNEEITEKDFNIFVNEDNKKFLSEINIEVIDKIESIKEGRIEFSRNGKTKNIEGDYIVDMSRLANKSNDIKQICQDLGIPFYVIGDALIPRKSLDAILEAFNISYFEID